MMDVYAQTLLIALPIFLVLMLIEAWIDHRRNLNRLHLLDSISSLSSGLSNMVRTSIKLIVVIVSYDYFFQFRGLTLDATWVTYVVAFIALDFAGYWEHRLDHSVNFFWNKHRIHHSSEEFNLPCALRQSISSIIYVTIFFLFPAALLGVPSEIIATVAPAHVFLQFWYHTRFIPKLGFLEYIIITPSQHRVHHAINPEYIDKNLGEIFSIWDRFFGTFQEELDDVEPVYGVTNPAKTWNPIRINFQHLKLMLMDAWHAKNYWDKLRIWFMPTGWRPEDVATAYQIDKINNVYAMEKYTTTASTAQKIWYCYQFVFTLLLTLVFFYNVSANDDYLQLMSYAFVLFLSIYSYTNLMDGCNNALIIEMVRAIIGLSILHLWLGSWYGIDQIVPYGSIIVSLYFLSGPVGYYWLSSDSLTIKKLA